MKDNRKKRKLTYIRKKNALRKGALMRSTIITTVEQTKIDGAIDAELLEEIKNLEKKWKTPLKLNGVNVGLPPDKPELIAINFTVIASQFNEAR